MLAYQADSITIGLVVSGLGLGIVLGSSYFYRLLRRRGARTILVFAAVVTLSLPLLHYLSLSPVMLILTRIVMGFGLSAFLLALRGLADASYTPERPLWTAKALLTSLLIGLLFGSALGGYLPYVTSFNWAFLISMAPAILALFLASGLSEPRRKTYARPLEKEDHRGKRSAPGSLNLERLGWTEILLRSLALFPLALVTTRLPLGDSPLAIISNMLTLLLVSTGIVYLGMTKPEIISGRFLWASTLISVVALAVTIYFSEFIGLSYLLPVFTAIIISGVVLLTLQPYRGKDAVLTRGMANLLAGAGLAIFAGNLLLAVLETWFYLWVMVVTMATVTASGWLALTWRNRLLSQKR
jgi:MFS family permease